MSSESFCNPYQANVVIESEGRLIPVGEDDDIEIWIIIVAIVAAVLVLVALSICLYCVSVHVCFYAVTITLFF